MKELPHKAAPLRLSVARRVYRLSGGSSFNRILKTHDNAERAKTAESLSWRFSAISAGSALNVAFLSNVLGLPGDPDAA
jgi:hypothetical protein